MYLYSKIFLTFGTLQLIFEINGLESAGTQKEVYYGKVQGNVSLPCRVEALEDNTVDNRTILVNWKRDKLFLMSASIDDTGQLSLDYLDTAMETNGKYVVMEDFSLMVSSLNMKDATDYICTMVMYSDETKVKEVSRYENISTLLVQDVPSIPGSVVITDVFSRNCTITWEHSRNENFCPIKAYIIQIQRLPNIKDWNNARQITVQMTIRDTPSSVIEDLLPHQFYQARVIALNDVGLSTPSLPSAMFPTVSEVPSGAPTIVYAHSLKSTEITLQWNPPPSFEINGVLSGFEIGYGVDDIMAAKQIITEENENARNITIIKLKPYTFYVVWIRAVNDVGPGPPAEMMVKTAEGRPSKPRIIDVSKKTSMSMFVSWEAPQEMNGELKSYELMWTSNESIKPLSQEIAGQVFNTNRAYISNLLPYTSYKIKVRAITGGGPGEWSDMYPAVTDVSGPGPPLNVNLTVLGSYSIYVQWEKPKLFYRDVEKYIIEYTSPGDFFQSYQKVDASDEQVQEVNITSIPTNRVYQLRIAGITNSLYPDTTLPEYVGNYSEYFMFTLKGDNPNDTISDVYNCSSINCSRKSSNSDGGVPKIHTNFSSNKDPSVESQDEEASSAGVIVGVISVIIVIIIAMIVIFISSRSMACRKCYRATFDYLAVPTNNNTPPTTVITIPEPLEEVTYTSVPVSEFLQHVKLLHADSDVGFSNEFNDIAKQTSGWNLKSDASNQPENASKNRYVNINAFDHSRVLLKPINGRMRSSDYINANYVDGYKRPKAYIATQGPLPQTFADFWRMVWEQNSVVIVMITKLVERGRKKCDQYWPDDGIEQYGPIQVKHLNTFSRAHYTVRMFSLKNTKIKKQYSERIVYHFHYTEWPDHGVPDFTLPVLKFVQKSAYINPPGAGPIVVHCSAGVGRTGTYILIDSMIEKIKEEKTINVPGFLLHIRRQRKFLVQTEEQYMLIHDALVEYILSHDTEIRHGDLTQYIQKLTSIHDGEVDTSLLRQWKLVTAFVPNETDKFSACRNVNVKKNRNKDFIPLSVKRVMLPAKPGIEGSDYINATYLQGYNKTNEFILTQHPIKESTEELESTKEDFWRMVWDQNSSVIFLLTDTDEEDFAPFWPSKEEPLAIDTGNFKVALRDEEEMARYKIREFILESTQDDYVLMTRIVTCDGWPHKDQPLHQAFNMIETIKELHKKNDIGPVIVVDRYGGIEGCVFCALWSLHDQQIHDKVVDIYHLCKLYHLKRPGIVGTQEDYLFLYQAMESFILDMGEKEMNNHNHYLHLKTSSAKRNGTMPRSPTLSNKETNV